VKVLAVTPLYPPSTVGAWMATHRMLKHLALRGHQVEVVTYMTPKRTGEYEGIRLRRKSDFPDATKSSDVVISHAGDDGHAHRYALRCGKPSVRMVHGEVPDGSMRGASLAVFNSTASSKCAPFNGTRIICRPHTDPDEYRTTPGDHVTLVNLSRAKGVMTMWQVAEMLPDIKFLGVRGGYGMQHIPRCDNVEVVPNTQDIRTDVYARTRVLMMPSNAETWGMTGVEAMCSGIPVIAHPTKGLRESLDHAGIFVDRDDLVGWAYQIRRLQDRDEWAEASAAALRRSSELSSDDSLDRFANAIEALA
jgi:hypothetical protein